jgi:transposase InsO family protein
MAQEVKDLCAKLGIKLNYASVYHPQSNGQVEWANGLILSGIKPRLFRSLKESDHHWVEELDSILWGLRTTPNRSTGYTPFFMV